jgi:murein DD-endopeptidase / murein LD-carboxypeptidase
VHRPCGGCICNLPSGLAHATDLKLARLNHFRPVFVVIQSMSADRKKIVNRENRAIAHFVVGMFIVVLLTAMIGRNQDPTHPQTTEIADVSPVVTDRIVAFKKGGAQKRIKYGYDIEKVIDHAEALIGTPHVMGGYSSRGIDCSGLVKLTHAKANLDLPRSSHDQARYGSIISPGEELRRGDLIFFHSTYKKENLVTHTGIYLGNNEFIHASSKLGVIVSKLNSDYYQKHYLFATRLKHW